MGFVDEAIIVFFFLITLGAPWALGFLGVVSIWTRSYHVGGGAVALALVLAFHPIARYTLQFRSSRLALALIRYFSFEIIVNRDDPLFSGVGTSAVDQLKFQQEHLPALYLACPHGVFNYGAIAWCCVSRWMCGWYQYTGAAGVVANVPGLRYLDLLIWLIPADRKNIKASLQVPEWVKQGHQPPVVTNPLGLFKSPHGDDDDEKKRRKKKTTSERASSSPLASSAVAGGVSASETARVGGMLGMVPDGILGAFRSKAGVDELAIGSKRGLLRIAAEEGATVYATWFFGTTEMLTVVQDPWGLMEKVSRKLQAGFLGYFGRWGLPVPRRVAVSVVVAPHKCEHKDPSPTKESLETLHQAVYGKLANVYDEQKGFAGYPNNTLLVT